MENPTKTETHKVRNPGLAIRNPLPALVREILAQLGENPQREGLLKTPERAARALRELTCGHEVDIDRLICGALFKADYSEMVLVKDIPLYSICEHHLLPFFGKAHIAYIPDEYILGLSKIPRLAEALSRRLQIQERLTTQIAETLQSKLRPLGVGVVIEARHLCLEMRGAKCQGAPTVTSAMLGSFRKDARTREEFLTLIRKPNS
ncbi:MAG: GTP cyclohydrolase I FolE [Elusimicrobia bacterium]|nr:GTP cyclohydrolase I FolE [Elusimicrobiota bacterium]